ncbi:MAG: hypothetical protein IKZ03_06400, partial [Clostridia bacterium]|nr:hypothetical protein [Clostridia bacterium]
DEDIMSSADLVVAITGRHAMEIMLRHPVHASKVAALNEDVPDPYGGSSEVYRRCLAEIERLLTESFGGSSTNE